MAAVPRSPKFPSTALDTGADDDDHHHYQMSPHSLHLHLFRHTPINLAIINAFINVQPRLVAHGDDDDDDDGDEEEEDDDDDDDDDAAFVISPKCDDNGLIARKTRKH